jgi:poly(A) polymerase/tRNA nucleotidyltransferase (CCA-adding enzyme)
MAWGAEPGGPRQLIDPHGGRADVATATLRAVGDPATRFGEDALRMIRAVRLAAELGFSIEPSTWIAIPERAELIRHLSGERLAIELGRLLRAPEPSVGFRLLHDSGLLAQLSPELAAQRGVAQNKIDGEDLWDHTLRAIDAAADRPLEEAATDPPATGQRSATGKPPVDSVRIRMAALLHDIGKPATMADGRFVGHETVGADLAEAFLERLRWPTSERDRITHLIRQHMFGYESKWSDAAVRRFIVKVGRDALDDLLLLREADNVASGQARDHGDLAAFRTRVAAQFEAGVALDLHDLAVDGSDLMTELGLEAGPLIGHTLRRLLERVIGDPALNTRDRLLATARSIVEHEPLP